MNTDIAVQHALDHLAKVGFEALTKTETTLAAAWLLEAGVTNEGFERYFSSKRGDLASHAPEALRLIGATQLAEIAAEANAVFGPSGPPRDRTARQNLVRALSESAKQKFTVLEERYVSCEEDVDELLEAFLARAEETK